MLLQIKIASLAEIFNDFFVNAGSNLVPRILKGK